MVSGGDTGPNLTSSGGDAGPNLTSKVYRLDLSRAGAGWVELPSLQETRRGHAMVCIGSRVYVLGGQGKDGRPLRTVEELTAEGWQTVNPGLHADFFCGSAVVIP